MEIREDDLSGYGIRALLERHLADAHANSPPGSVHALDLSGLQAADVTFWCVWEGQNLMGCGALKMLDRKHGEIKSMRTHPDHLRKGVGAAILTHIINTAKARGCTRLSLETGNNAPYAPARALYRRFGFEDCPPFANYVEDDFSLCMTKKLKL
ncbi:MAG: GNAT family N-acetyltransferase [Acidimicrobiales bacterium]|nr:MAG: GNAT family N-acetyltransferase [Acidimicrobiales bacterium]